MTGSGRLTVGRWLSDRAAITPTRNAIEFGGTTTSYAALDQQSDVAGQRLAARGLERGDRVAVLAANCPEYAALVFGCAKRGLIVVPLSWRLTDGELGYQIRDSTAAIIVHDHDHAEPAAKARSASGQHAELLELRELVNRDQPPGGGPADAAPAGPTGTGPDWGVADDDGLFLVYTSGTTGSPKGALLTHANCFWTNLSLDRTADIAPDDVVLQVLPQFHVAGWNVQPLLAWWKGATIVLERTFDPVRTLDLIAARRVTTMMGVPANYLFMAEAPGFAEADLSSLRYVLVGGAPMPKPLLQRWNARGVRIIQGYGLTEAAPNVLCLPPEHAKAKLGYAGKPYPYVEVALADPVTGELLGGAAAGELLVRGPNVFAGYWQNPGATAAVMREGWLHTGDIAERDADGFYRIRDRLKDMYVSGGENVYPAEIEAVLDDHPEVTEAAVIAMPDPRWGEAGLAVVALRAGAEVAPEELRSFCAGRLARFKIPREVRFVDALPRSAMNKVLKNELRARFLGPGTADSGTWPQEAR